MKKKSYEADKPENASNYWTTIRHRALLLNIFWFTSFTVIIGGIVYVVAKREQRRDYTDAERIKEERTLNTQQDVVIIKSSDAIRPERSAFVITEMYDLPTEEESMANAPLSGRWIKAAARHIMLGDSAYRNEDYSSALREFRDALTMYPEIEGIRGKIGLILLKQKRYDLAIENLTAAAKESEQKTDVLNNLGTACLAAKEMNKAEEAFKQVLEIDPEHQESQLNLALLYHRKNMVKESFPYFRKYCEKNPNDLAAARMFAMALMKDKEWKEATRLLLGIVDQAPDIGPVYFELAQAMALGENQEAAIKMINRGVILVDPKQALAFLNTYDFGELRNSDEFIAVIEKLTNAQ